MNRRWFLSAIIPGLAGATAVGLKDSKPEPELAIVQAGSQCPKCFYCFDCTVRDIDVATITDLRPVTCPRCGWRGQHRLAMRQV